MAMPQRTFLVLLALKDEPLYGYALRKKVLILSRGRLELEPGGLYRLIARLQGDGLVEAAPKPPSDTSADTRRRYYQLTPPGHDALREEAVRLTELAALSEVRTLAGGRGR